MLQIIVARLTPVILSKSSPETTSRKFTGNPPRIAGIKHETFKATQLEIGLVILFQFSSPNISEMFPDNSCFLYR